MAKVGQFLISKAICLLLRDNVWQALVQAKTRSLKIILEEARRVWCACPCLRRKFHPHTICYLIIINICWSFSSSLFFLLLQVFFISYDRQGFTNDMIMIITMLVSFIHYVSTWVWVYENFAPSFCAPLFSLQYDTTTKERGTKSQTTLTIVYNDIVVIIAITKRLTSYFLLYF